MTIWPMNAQPGAAMSSVFEVNGYSNDIVIHGTIQLPGIPNLVQEIEEMKSQIAMLNRRHNLEEMYPELKRAADDYHRIRNKYEMIEELKR